MCISLHAQSISTECYWCGLTKPSGPAGHTASSKFYRRGNRNSVGTWSMAPWSEVTELRPEIQSSELLPCSARAFNAKDRKEVMWRSPVPWGIGPGLAPRNTGQPPLEWPSEKEWPPSGPQVPTPAGGPNSLLGRWQQQPGDRSQACHCPLGHLGQHA